MTVEITRAGEEPEIRVPMDLRKALAGAPPARAGWEDITPMARRDWIFSISSAKQPETRTRRIGNACDMLASGKRRLCCFPGIKWLMKKKRKIMRNVASVAELTKSFCAEIDKVAGITVFAVLSAERETWHTRTEFELRAAVPFRGKLHHANNKRRIFHHTQ